MDNAQLLEKLCAALAIGEDEMTEIFRLSGYQPTSPEENGLPTVGTTASSTDGADPSLNYFLEGLILRERGPRTEGAPVVVESGALSNNQVLKKLRIALKLQTPDMLAILEEGGLRLSVSELGAMFRKESNKHFRPCSDAMLQSFLKGLG